ncbi:MAG TPA: competence type IV pilus major pilin ComGC [Bacillales bacterium]|nr:competence type IV pilus major pilin ComGC [Bacillales bacterium]
MLKNEQGFTLIEMMIVLMIISVLLMIAIPNMVKSNNVVKEKTCESTIHLLQSEVETYAVEHGGTMPNSLTALKEEGYVDKVRCPDAELRLVDGRVMRDVDASQ